MNRERVSSLLVLLVDSGDLTPHGRRLIEQLLDQEDQ